MSKPCKNCILALTALGIKRILYSNDDGEIISEKIRDISSDHVSLYWRKVKRKCIKC
jgi:deoxycytidylate deaminase